MTGTVGDERVAQGYTAEVLLERPWRFDMGELAEALGTRFDALGSVAAVPAEGPDLPDALDIDGARLPIEIHDQKAEIADPAPGLLPVRSWDPDPAIGRHRAHIRVSCGGAGGGLVWMKAYATVVTLVAGALAKLGPGLAVRFPASDVYLAPDDAYLAGRTALRGVSPIEAWVSLYVIAAVAPQPEAPEEGMPALPAPEAHGALTLGLRPFLGREIALAPVQVAPHQAAERARGAAWNALDGETPLADGQEIVDPHSGYRTRVRAAREWVRPGLPVFVLVGADSTVDAETLALRQAVPNPLADAVKDLPSTETLKAVAAELPKHLTREGKAAMATALPVIGKGARAVGEELKRTPEHARAAWVLARKVSGTAAEQTKAAVAKGRAILEARRARATERTTERTTERASRAADAPTPPDRSPDP